MVLVRSENLSVNFHTFVGIEIMKLNNDKDDYNRNNVLHWYDLMILNI